MHDHYPTPRIRDRLQLIPPPASDHDGDRPEDLAGRRGEQPEKQQRLLLVEDEVLLSMVLATDLQDAGYDVLGPYGTVAAAMAAVLSETFDGAVLDINLKGQLVYPVAEELARRRIPFMFLSGYALVNMPKPFHAYPRLAKPANATVLLRAIQNMLTSKPV
jgi:DNA-binding response OmpR family regulator